MTPKSPKGEFGAEVRPDFNTHAVEAFAFLAPLGFSTSQSEPGLVRYRKNDITIDIYHGRSSYELGLGVTHNGVRYSLSAIIRASDPEAAGRYRNFAATTEGAIVKGLAQLAELLDRHGQAALQGDPDFFAKLQAQRVAAAHQLALGSLANQVRPRADAAFRRGDYRQAAELYEQIVPCLTASERRRLEIAKERTRDDG
jgi:hypothetical protein